MVLNNEWVNQEIKEKTKKKHGNKWKCKHNGPKSSGCSKAVLRGKFIAIQTYLKRQEKNSNKHPNILPKGSRKRRTNKTTNQKKEENNTDQSRYKWYRI